MKRLTTTHSLPILLGLTVGILLAVPIELLAQKPIPLLEPIPVPGGGGDVTEINVGGPFPLDALNQYLQPFMPWAFGMAAGLTVLMIIIGGFQIMLAGGGEGQRAGKDRILSALFGLMILVFSATILYMLNANFFRLGGTP